MLKGIVLPEPQSGALYKACSESPVRSKMPPGASASLDECLNHSSPRSHHHISDMRHLCKNRISGNLHNSCTRNRHHQPSGNRIWSAVTEENRGSAAGESQRGKGGGGEGGKKKGKEEVRTSHSSWHTLWVMSWAELTHLSSKSVFCSSSATV